MGQAVEAAYFAIRSKRELFGKGLEVELGGEEEAVEQWNLLLSAAESCKFRFGVTSHNCTEMWQALNQRAENEQGPFSIRDQQHIFSPFESLAAPKAKLASNLCASVPLLSCRRDQNQKFLCVTSGMHLRPSWSVWSWWVPPLALSAGAAFAP